MDEYHVSQPPVRTFSFVPTGDPMRYVQQTVTVAAGLLTIPASANRAIIQPEDGDIRYRDDGVSPTASVGMYLQALGTLDLQSQAAINGIQLVAVSGTVKVNISYYMKK